MSSQNLPRTSIFHVVDMDQVQTGGKTERGFVTALLVLL